MQAVDKLDLESVMALLGPRIHLLTADGRRAEGTEAARELLMACVGTLRSAAHEITAQWHLDNVWIAEAEASYEFQDWLQLNALPRAFVVCEGQDGISDLRIYGAHEQPLTDHRTGEEGLLVGGREIPPL